MSGLPKLDDWKAPWELDANKAPLPEDQQVIDKAKLKKYLHGLLSDKERLQTTVTDVTTERDTLKAEKAEKEREGETELQRITRERDEAKAAAQAASTQSTESLALEILSEKDGITIKDAKFLASRARGKDRAEVEKDIEQLVERFGVKAGGEGNQQTDPPNPLNGKPQPVLTPGDPTPGSTPTGAGKSIDELFPRN